MLFKKLLLTYISVLIVVLSIIGFTAVRITAQTVDKEIRLANIRAVENGAAAVDVIIETANSLALEVCVNKNVQRLLKKIYVGTCNKSEINGGALLRQEVRRLLLGAKYIEPKLYPIDHLGRVYELDPGTNTIVASVQLPKQSWFANALAENGGFAWMKLHSGNKTFIRMSRIILDSSKWDRIIGVLTFDINVYDIGPKLYQIKLGNTGVACLIAKDGSMIFPFIENLNLDTSVLKGTVNTSYINKRGELVIVRVIPEADWKLVGIIPLNELLEKGRKIRNTFLMTGIVAILCCIALALYFSYSISNPIIKLAAKMKSVESGDLDIVITEPAGSGEINILYHNFNYMIKMINELIEEVYKTKIREKEAELMALQAQINPHFLYNTLDSVNWLAMKYNAFDIKEIVSSLAAMLRYSLNNGENYITVENEINQVKNYIAIQNYRYSDCFTVDYEIDADTKAYTIIKLLLQPLVENAIIHGIEGNTEKAKISILIKSYLDQGHLIFEVKNDGQPVDLKAIEHVLNPDNVEKPKSYGIKNVNDRLKKQYGDGYGLKFDYNGGYTIVTICIPVYKSWRE
jgi:two-component system sensor histidine kinase YesM